MNNSMVQFCKLIDVNKIPELTDCYFEATNDTEFYLHHKGSFYLIKECNTKQSNITCRKCKFCKLTLYNETRQLKSVSCFDWLTYNFVVSKQKILELLLTKDYYELRSIPNE